MEALFGRIISILRVIAPVAAFMKQRTTKAIQKELNPKPKVVKNIP